MCDSHSIFDGGLVVSMLAFYSNDPSSIPALVNNFSSKFVVEKIENKQKEAAYFYMLLLGSALLMDPHLSHQRVGLQHSLLTITGITRPKARFKPTLSKSLRWMEGANRPQQCWSVASPVLQMVI